jgi:hypothetical protein
MTASRPSSPGRATGAATVCVCCLSMFMIAVDTTVVNLALPLISGSLHTPVSGLQAGFAAASHPAWLVIAACGGAVLLVSLVSTSRRAGGPSQDINGRHRARPQQQGGEPHPRTTIETQ